MLSHAANLSRVLGRDAERYPEAEAGPKASLKTLLFDRLFLGAFDSLRPGRPGPLAGEEGLTKDVLREEAADEAENADEKLKQDDTEDVETKEELEGFLWRVG